MDKNTLANALLINKLQSSKKDLEQSIKDIEKELPTLVGRLFDGLDAESKLDSLLADVNKDYIQKLGITIADLKSEMQKIIIDESGKTQKDLIAQYKKDIASIELPKDGYTPIKGKDYDDGKDYVVTKEDLDEIASMVNVELPEIEEMTVEQLSNLLKDIKKDEKVLDVSNITGLEDKIRKIELLSGRGIGGVGKRTTKLTQLTDVDYSGLSIVDGKYVLGGGGASQLSDLSDVNTSTPTDKNVLVADGVDWESRALVEADISDLGSYQPLDAQLTSIAGLVPGAEGRFVVSDGLGGYQINNATAARLYLNVENGADVTDTANVTAAGALMDSELTSIADVKALDQSVVSGASPVFSTSNMTEGTDKNFVTDAEATIIGNTSGTNTGDEVAATTTTAGIVEKSTSAENVAGTSDTVYPTVAGTKEMIDTHAGGGGGATPILRIPGGRNTLTSMYSINKLGDNLFISNSSNVYKFTRLSDGLDFIPNNDNGTTDNWSSIIGAIQFTKIDDSDTVLYFTTGTASQIRYVDIGTKALTTMTVSGGTFTANAGIVSDGTDLIILQASSTTAKRFSVSGTTATYVEDITLPYAPSSTIYLAGADMFNGNIYYFADNVSTLDRFVKWNLAGDTEEVMNDYVMRDNTVYSYGSSRAIFNDGNFVYIANGVNDSEDNIGVALSVIDKL